jgi:hypothetical protein
MSSLLRTIALLFIGTSAAFAQTQPTKEQVAPQSVREKPDSRFVPRGYIRLTGESGVSIEVPNDWRILSTQELIEESKQRPTPATAPKVEVLAMAQLLISGAAISVSIQRPPLYTQRSLEKVSESELRSASEQMHQEFKGKRSQSDIGTVVSGPIYEVRELPGKPGKVLTVRYREEELSPKGRSLIWKTTHLHIPRNSDEIQVTLSYRESDEVFWQPVMAYAIASLRY